MTIIRATVSLLVKVSIRSMVFVYERYTLTISALLSGGMDDDDDQSINETKYEDDEIVRIIHYYAFT
jgi:hypothetical protein